MFKKYGLAILGAGASILGVVASASAQVVVPTSTVASLETVAGSQISDPGTLLVIVLAAGIPLAFYLIHKLIGLVPKGRGGRRE
jgi:hypothetical protein